MELLVIVSISAIFVIYVWFIYCNNVTLKQRLDILGGINTLEDIEKYRDIPYAKHLWYLFTFRDYSKLYEHIKLHKHK